MQYVMYREASSNLWRWILYDGNGRMLAQSVEKHYNRDDCAAAIAAIKNSGAVPVIDRPDSRAA